MSSKKRPAAPAADPATDANRRILADRDKRIREQDNLAVDLGLEIPETPAASATEFIDEWDKKNFGLPVPAYTRTIYGPDPLLQSCPAMKAAIERVGLEEYAACTAEAILKKEEMAISDPVLRKGLRAAIRRFGKENVAAAFRDRILRIPSREVEVEVDRDIDEMLGKPLDEAVERWGEPGYAYKFLSPRCIDVLGMRGYEIVRQPNGDPVKAGTLLMARIPEHIAARRRAHWAEESEKQVREAEESYRDAAERELRNAGVAAAGSRVLSADELMTANATEEEAFLGQSRQGGVRIERQQ